MTVYDITPVAKPRMTQRDRWSKRPAVMRYRAYYDEIRLRNIKLPMQYHVTFILPMPDAWSEKKKAEHDGAPHRRRPDKDNFEKAILDALFVDDSGIWDGRVTKRWGRTGKIIIDEIPECCR